MVRHLRQRPFKGRFHLSLPALLLSVPANLQAQYIGPPPGLIVLGEWQVGLATVPPDLKHLATDGSRRTFGVAFPFWIGQEQQLRLRYDDDLFSGSRAYASGYYYATADTEVKIRKLSLDYLYAPGAQAWNFERPYLYGGAGVGLAQTWHTRTSQGSLMTPGLPRDAEALTWSPAGRVFFGLRLFASLAVEAQFEASSHQFEGVSYLDASASLCLRFSPMMLAAGKDPRN
jgi:hypothetical protein